MPEDSSPWKSHPWFVLLKLQVPDFYRQFTGTLISSRYVVTAAETFFETKPEDFNTASNPENWKALPGARHFEDIEFVDNSNPDWMEIAKIDIHNMFQEGYIADRGYVRYI